MVANFQNGGQKSKWRQIFILYLKSIGMQSIRQISNFFYAKRQH
jgi:hypothetical protein